MLDPDAERAHVLGDPREVDLVEGPQFARLLGLGAAVDAVEAALGLVAAAVVVDDGHRVDLPAHRGLDVADVIPEPGIAGEGHHRPLRRAALRPEPRRERPAEMAGAANVALVRALQVVHAAHPHAGVAGIDHDDRVVRYMLGQLATDALGPNRHRVGFKRGLILTVPLLADGLRLRHPGSALSGAGL